MTSCVVLLLLSGAYAKQRPVPILTVCEVLQNRTAFHGKRVIIVGRLDATPEGSWLTEDCEWKLITDGYTWGKGISLTYDEDETRPPPSLRGVQWDEAALFAKLSMVKMTTKLPVVPQAPNQSARLRYRHLWQAVYGRFETRINFRFQRISPEGELVGDGFGHLNGAPAQLIWPKGGRYSFHPINKPTNKGGNL